MPLPGREGSDSRACTNDKFYGVLLRSDTPRTDGHSLRRDGLPGYGVSRYDHCQHDRGVPDFFSLKRIQRTRQQRGRSFRGYDAIALTPTGEALFIQDTCESPPDFVAQTSLQITIQAV